MIYKLYYLYYLLTEWLKGSDQKEYSKAADRFVEWNNKRVLKYLIKTGMGPNDRAMILLPHCLQYHDCQYRITGNIDNCRDCGRCVIADLKKLKDKYPVDIRVATGGTLARKYVKEIRPKVILAVACKRDLMSGIRDTYPMKVYGIFNEIKEEPCIDTSVSVEKITDFFNKVYTKR